MVPLTITVLVYAVYLVARGESVSLANSATALF
jgi:hypothetical protein